MVRVKGGFQVWQVSQVYLDFQDQKDHLGQEVKKETTDFQDHLDPKELEGFQVCQDFQERQESLGYQVRMGLPELQVSQDAMEQSPVSQDDNTGLPYRIVVKIPQTMNRKRFEYI
ncbi:UNVERIFIED_CONTAM: hypothetical protein K2H54_047303 [Gekko kuhli]